MNKPHRTYEVCGVPIAALAPEAAADALVLAARDGLTVQVHLCNAYTLSLVDQDPTLRTVLSGGSMNLPDGAPVAWFGRKHGVTGPVRGPSLMRDVVDRGRAEGLRHYYFGAAPGIAERLAAAFELALPGAVTAGTFSPPFGDLDDSAVEAAAARIRATDADIVWVGIGTPRQDYLVPRLAQHLDMPIVPVGAAFDFWSGTVAQSPQWLHGTGLEWLHRLVTEPRRLWRRYLIGNPRFLLIAARHSVLEWRTPRAEGQ